MKSPLHYLELSLYFIAWTSINLYSLYKLFVVQTYILEKYPLLKHSLRDLSPGWAFLGREKDVSDVEWSSWKFYIQTSWFYMILQFVVSEIIRKSWPSVLKYWYILSSIIFISFYMGSSQMLLIIVQPIIFSAIILLGGKRIAIWLASIILLASYNSLKNKYFLWQFLDHGNLQDEEVYLLMFGVAWIELRCIVFSLDYVEKVEKLKKNKELNKLPSHYETVLNLLSYVLYLPLLYVGPIMLYEDFESSFHADNQAKLIPRLKRFAVDMVLFIIYTFLMDLALHYMYFYAMHGNMQSIRTMPTLALCGGGLWMGFQFHLKYVISYGITAAFARLDNMNPPPTPRCIARIHVYSQMWRYFDVGLYKFLVKYIYRPGYSALSHYISLSKLTYKLIASFATFTFIFLWHGTVWNIFVWSVLNYFGILMEYSAKAVAVTDAYKRFKKRFLKSEAAEVRFIAVMCSPLLTLSGISNFYLFGGSEIGNMYFGLFAGPLLYNLSVVLLSVYCCCHVSIALQNVSTRTDVKRLTKAD